MTMRHLILLGSAALAVSACSKPKPKAPSKAAEGAVAVSVAQVRSLPIATGLSAPGLLVAREEATVSTQLSGFRVAQVLVDQNDMVAAGQPVAKLDDTLLQSQMAQQQAVVTQQKVGAERAEQQAQRVAGLDDAGVLSQEQILERRLNARSARAVVLAAQAGMNDLRTRQGLMTVRAPVSGRVLERTVRPGDVATPSQPMFRIARGGIVELNAEVAESDLAKIAPGQSAEVELPSGGRVAGSVRLVSPQVNAQTKLGSVRVLLPTRPDLRIGGYGRAIFSGLIRQVPAVPEAAVRYDADGASVMTVDADNRVHRVSVKTGARANGVVEILQGPPVGSRVALGGSSFVMEGDKVRPVAVEAVAVEAKAP